MADIILAILLTAISLVQMAAVIDLSNTKLVRLNFVGYLGMDQYADAFLLWVWAIALGMATSFVVRGSTASPTIVRWSSGTAIVLAILGAVGISTISFDNQQEAFASRGQDSGNGLRALLYWASAVYVSYVMVYWRKTASVIFVVFALTYGSLLFISANRSPMALILISILVRIWSDQRYRVLNIGMILSPLVLLLFAYQSTWRGLVARGVASSPPDVLKAVIGDPLNAIQRVGFDSIDGMVLAQSLLERGFPPKYFDPFIAVLNFVPRQFWPDKPVLLGSTIGWEYLGLSAGGIFLSGPGYTSLVTGSIFTGILLFVFLMYLAKLALVRFRADALICCAVLYFVARFPLAGDSFDVFLTLQIILIYQASRFCSFLLLDKDHHDNVQQSIYRTGRPVSQASPVHKTR